MSHRLPAHVLSPAAAREGDHTARAQIEHPTVSDGSGGPTVRFPIGGDGYAFDVSISSPLRCERVSSGGAALDDLRDRSLGMNAIESSVEECRVVVGAAAADDEALGYVRSAR